MCLTVYACMCLELILGDQQQKGRGQRPSFTQKPAIKQEGENIVMECKLTADPKPSITWLHGTKALKDGGRIKIEQAADGNSYTLRLVISQVSQEDGGEYKVTAKNALGESNATINLNFEGRFDY